MCDHYHCLILEISSFLKRKLPFSISNQPPFLPQPLEAQTYFSSLELCLPGCFIEIKIIHLIEIKHIFDLWLVESTNVDFTDSGMIHWNYESGTNPPWILRVDLFCGMDSQMIAIQSSVCDICDFYILTIVNNAMTAVDKSLWGYMSLPLLSLWAISRSGIVGSYIGLLYPWGTAELFSKMTISFDIPTSSVWRLQCFHISTTLAIVCLFKIITTLVGKKMIWCSDLNPSFEF